MNAINNDAMENIEIENNDERSGQNNDSSVSSDPPAPGASPTHPPPLSIGVKESQRDQGHLTRAIYLTG